VIQLSVRRLSSINADPVSPVVNGRVDIARLSARTDIYANANANSDSCSNTVTDSNSIANGYTYAYS